MSHSKHAQFLFLSLSILTILFFNLYERYTPVSPELLDNTELSPPSTKWNYPGTESISSNGGTIRLHSDNYSTDTYITQTIPVVKPYKFLRLSADTKTQAVSKGRQHWMSARVILLTYKPDGTPIYSIPHNLINLYGSHEWSLSSNVFKIPETTSKISISAQLTNVTGTFWVKDLSLRAVDEKASFRILRIILMGIWVAIIISTLPFLMQQANESKCYRVALSLGLIISIGALVPADIKNSFEQFFFNSVSITPPSVINRFTFQLIPENFSFNTYKIGHFILFSLISFIFLHCKSKQLPGRHVLYDLFFFAITTEVLQLFIVGRNPSLRDLLIDFSGIILGMLLYLKRKSASKQLGA